MFLRTVFIFSMSLSLNVFAGEPETDNPQNIQQVADESIDLGSQNPVETASPPLLENNTAEPEFMVHVLEPMSLQMKDSKNLELWISIEGGPKTADRIQNEADLIPLREAIAEYTSNKSTTELQSLGDKLDLRNGIRKLIRDTWPDAQVKQVYFSRFVY